ncbi:hypothetical protein BO78DRAFT_102467 [Aspergillus sclerotiicarbonarius CBS 121057]|uniref:Uncharacterized protein n=1 Tax=Aspergillus sclerotiicarbonarius (strain CBS 121057 / IBT 28362) TaxID=1448318 RepID=A0A319ENR6_ASPSB|nr:hypothetical protein BO78DRAFT_102467 [Aspergillus sclerotiicarbonarius CBS 121057]
MEKPWGACPISPLPCPAVLFWFHGIPHSASRRVQNYPFESDTPETTSTRSYITQIIRCPSHPEPTQGQDCRTTTKRVPLKRYDWSSSTVIATCIERDSGGEIAMKISKGFRWAPTTHPICVAHIGWHDHLGEHREEGVGIDI